MPSLWRERIAEIVLVALASAYLFRAHLGPPIDFDLWFFLRMGEYILSSGTIPHDQSFLAIADRFPSAYLYNDEWAFGCLVALIYRAWGMTGLAYALPTLILAQGLLLYFSCRLVRLQCLPSLLLTALGLQLMSTRFLLRPQILADCFLTALLIVLLTSRDHPRRLWLAPLVLLGWTTFHASVFLGLIVVTGWLLCHLVQRWLPPSVFAPSLLAPRQAAAVLAASIAATCCRPIGPYIFLFVAEHFTASKKLDWITEWWPLTKMWPTWYLGCPGLFVLLLVVGTALAIRRRRLNLAAPVLVCGLLFLAFRYNRGVGELTAGGIPLLAWLWSEAPSWRRIPAAITAALAALPLYGLLSLPPLQSFDPPDYIYPVGAVAYLKDHPAPGALFCSYQFGSFLVFHRQPVFHHSMCDFYSEDVTKAYWSLRDNPAELPQFTRTFGLGGFVLHYEYFDNQKRLIAALDQSPDWSLVYWDDVCLLYLPSRLGLPAFKHANPAFPDQTLEHPRESRQDLERYLESYPNARRGRKLLARLLTAQKDPAAGEAWDRLVQVAPQDGEGYLERGRWRYQQGDWAAALEDLRQACRLSPDSEVAHYNLAICLLAAANKQPGQAAELKAAAIEALNHAPSFPPAQQLKRQL